MTTICVGLSCLVSKKFYTNDDTEPTKGPNQNDWDSHISISVNYKQKTFSSFIQ